MDVVATDNTLYVTSLSGFVTSCTVTSAGALTSCSRTGSNFYGPAGITTFETNGVAKAAIANYGDDSVTICDSSGGSLSNCVLTPSPALNYPYGISVYQDTVFVSNHNSNNVVSCALVNSGTPGTQSTISSCFEVLNNIAQPGGMVDNNGQLYVTSKAGDSVNLCDIGTGGTLNNCKSVGSGFSFPAYMVQLGDFLYTTNYRTGTLSECFIQTNGTLANCVVTSSAFSFPTGIYAKYF